MFKALMPFAICCNKYLRDAKGMPPKKELNGSLWQVASRTQQGLGYRVI